MREIEVKYRVDDLECLLSAHKARGIEVGDPLHQDDRAYAPEEWRFGDSKLGVSFLRLCSTAGRHYFTLKQPAQNEQARLEYETEVADREAMHHAALQMGFRPTVRIVKTSRTATIGECRAGRTGRAGGIPGRRGCPRRGYVRLPGARGPAQGSRLVLRPVASGLTSEGDLPGKPGGHTACRCFRLISTWRRSRASGWLRLRFSAMTGPGAAGEPGLQGDVGPSRRGGGGRGVAARRVPPGVAEELGLDRPPGPVLAVDWVPSRPGRPEGLVVVYNGGVLPPEVISGSVLADRELAGFAFVPGRDIAQLVTPLLARRVASCLDAVAAGTVAALENGSPAG